MKPNTPNIAEIRQMVAEADAIMIIKSPEIIVSLCDEVERLQKALEGVISDYESEGTDIQVVRKMLNRAREALRRDTP